jgi:hypothetical protein
VAKIIFFFCFVSKKVLQKCTVVYTAKEGNRVILSPILVNLALQKLIKNIKMVPSGIKISKEQINILAYADDIVKIKKNETEVQQPFVEIKNMARKLGLHINQGKTKFMIVEQKNRSKQNKIGQ